jgi:hypothetical protein
MANLREVLGPMPVNAGHSLNQGRVAWWLVMPNRDGGRSVMDLYGRYSGACTNMDTTTAGLRRGTTRPGGYGQVVLAANGQRVEAADAVGLRLGAAGSIAIWVNSRDWSTNGSDVQLIGKQSAADSAHCNYRIEYFSGFLFLVVGDTSASVNIGPSWSPVDRTWYRIVGTWNATALTLYVNGVQLGTGANSIAPTSTTGVLQVGNVTASSDTPLFGAWDDASLWNRCLSAAEVKQDYELSRTGYPGVLRYPGPLMRKGFIAAAAAAASQRQQLSLGGLRGGIS